MPLPERIGEGMDGRSPEGASESALNVKTPWGIVSFIDMKTLSGGWCPTGHFGSRMVRILRTRAKRCRRHNDVTASLVDRSFHSADSELQMVGKFGEAAVVAASWCGGLLDAEDFLGSSNSVFSADFGESGSLTVSTSSLGLLPNPAHISGKGEVMMRVRQIGRGLMALLIGMGVAGCGASASAYGTTHASSSKKAIAATATTATSVPVHTGSVTIAGKRGTVLTTVSGQTLYWFTADTPTQSHCTGACTRLWPPLVTSATHLTGPNGVSGSLTIVKDAHGHQVAYNGHLLYTYAGDTAAGQAKGQGLALNGGKWWVATPGLKAGATTVATSGSGWSSGTPTQSGAPSTSTHAWSSSSG